MSVAFDAATESSTWTTTPDPFTFTHTPSGTPRAAVLYVVYPSANLEIDGTPTYGGVSFTHAWRIGGALDGEPAFVYCFFLDNVASGAQTVSIPHTAAATVKIATAITVTAGGPVFPVGMQAVRCGPGGTLAAMQTSSIGTGANALRFWGAFSGLGAPSGLTPLTGTTEVSSHDFGNNTAFITREDSESTSHAMGFTGTGDDLASLTIALSETEEPLIATYRWSMPTSATAHVITLPPVLDSGDLVLLNFASSINGGTITPSGGPTLTRFDDNTNLGTMVSGFWWFESDGTEDDSTIDFVTSTATNGSGMLHMIHIPASARDTNQDPECTVTGPTASGTPDPNGLTPSWGNAEVRWFVSLVRDANDGISSVGANYTDRFYYSTSTGVEIGTSWRVTTASSEDPGSSTVGTTDEEFKAYVVGVLIAVEEEDITGTGSSTLGNDTSAGTGVVGYPSTGTSTLDGVTSAGSGLVSNPITGTGSSTLTGVTSSGTGTLGVNGTGSSTLDGVTSEGSGLTANPVTGTGASTLTGVTSTGTGLILLPGQITNVVCELIGLEATCLLVGPDGTCDVSGPDCVSTMED